MSTAIIFGLLLLTLGLAVLSCLWVIRHHPRPCPLWLAWLLESRPFSASLAESTLDRIGLEPGQRVLEVGAGTGRLLIPAARRILPGGAVIGMDIQVGMLKRLKARAEQMGIRNLGMLAGDATQPHVQPESFDVVYLCGTLGEIPDRQAALEQCYVALKHGGRLSITEIFPDPDYQSRATVRRLGEAGGFRLSAIHGRWYYFTANFVKDSPRKSHE